MTLLERMERKESIRSVLGLKVSESKSRKPYDILKFENSITTFFNKLNIPRPFGIIEVRYLPKDMFISFEGDILVLEEAFILSVSPDQANIIIIHELYHKFFQNMNPDMIEVKYLRDCFGEQTIIEMDIDADIETFLFFKENSDLDFAKYLEMIYSTQNKSDSSIARIPKLVRSIGSLISIYISQKVGIKQILVPNLNQIRGSQHYMACISNGRKYAKTPSVEPLVNLHLQIREYTKDQFIALITNFCEDIYNCIKPQLRLQ